MAGEEQRGKGVNTGFNDVLSVRLFAFVLRDEDSDVLFSFRRGWVGFGLAAGSK